MNYVGIDIHKRYSVLAAQDEAGRKVKKHGLRATRPRSMCAFFKVLERPRRTVLEACWELGLTLDVLEEIGQVTNTER